MTTGSGLPPLKVNPEELSAAGHALSNAAADLPSVPNPFMPVGADPLSVAIIGQIPAIETPLETQLPLIKAQATTTAENVVQTAQDYVATDARNGAAINEMMQRGPTGTGSPGGGGPAAAGGGGADSMGQMAGMPMQMAGQMAQMPMQVMGAVAAVPQGLMQGVQQAGQQVQQVAGQFGQGATGSPGGSAGEQRSPLDGAASGEPHAERAPDPKEKADGNGNGNGGEAPGRHRAVEPDDRMDV